MNIFFFYKMPPFSLMFKISRVEKSIGIQLDGMVLLLVCQNLLMHSSCDPKLKKFFDQNAKKRYYSISNLPKTANLPGGHLSLTKHKIQVNKLVDITIKKSLVYFKEPHFSCILFVAYINKWQTLLRTFNQEKKN